MYKMGDLVKIWGYNSTIFVITSVYTNLGGWGPNSSEFRNVKDMNHIVYLPNRNLTHQVKKVS